MTAPAPKIADRGRRYFHYTALGALCGLAVGAALGVWITYAPPGTKHTPRQFNNLMSIAISVGLLTTIFGGSLGLWLTRFVTTAASGRRWTMLRHVLIGAGVGVLLFQPVGALIILDLGWGSLSAKLSLLGVMLLIFAGIGAGIGLGTGEDAAAEDEKRERQAMKARAVGGPNSLDVMRSALERALTEKFGSLDDERRERIRTWDEGRVAEAARKLPEAKTIDEVD